jgi:hypothetical protein
MPANIVGLVNENSKDKATPTKRGSFLAMAPETTESFHVNKGFLSSLRGSLNPEKPNG